MRTTCTHPQQRWQNASKKICIFDNNQQSDLGKCIVQDWENIYDTSWENFCTLHQFLSQEMLETRVYVVSGTQLSYSSLNFLFSNLMTCLVKDMHLFLALLNMLTEALDGWLMDWVTE